MCVFVVCSYAYMPVGVYVAQQQKETGARQQQCPHMQRKCACKATSMGGLAKDESLLAYLSVYSISGVLSCACSPLKL